jgi:2-dehydro-3-deoxyglucarate aldolase/4-hydroxy-2-oxoheptanedioate aldolase
MPIGDTMTFPDIRTDRRFKDKLSASQLTLGTFVQVGGPEVVEICGAVDLDFVILDTEHTPVGWERLSAMCVSAMYAGTFPLLRIGSTEQALVTRALDTGARGVMFPQVQSAAQAAVASRACRYPPDGTRGAAGTRNMGWGVTTTLAEYIPTANDGVVCVIQIETRQGVDNVEAIAAVPGVDCLFVGLSDLSVDFGCPGQYAHADVETALDQVLTAGKANGVAVGIPIANFDLADAYRERGVSFFATTDRAVVVNGMASFKASF